MRSGPAGVNRAPGGSGAFLWTNRRAAAPPRDGRGPIAKSPHSVLDLSCWVAYVLRHEARVGAGRRLDGRRLAFVRVLEASIWWDRGGWFDIVGWWSAFLKRFWRDVRAAFFVGLGREFGAMAGDDCLACLGICSKFRWDFGWMPCVMPLMVWVQAESLILAQNERWRRA